MKKQKKVQELKLNILIDALKEIETDSADVNRTEESYHNIFLCIKRIIQDSSIKDSKRLELIEKIMNKQQL